MTEKPTFGNIYMKLAESLAQKSYCVRKQVGAVIAKDNRVVSIGYNGPPAKTNNGDTQWPGEGCPKTIEGSCSLALHAEANAILYAFKDKASLEKTTLYVTLSPCLSCARIIYTVGITKVYYLNSYAEYKGLETDEGLDFLRKFGVGVFKQTQPIKMEVI